VAFNQAAFPLFCGALVHNDPKPGCFKASSTQETQVKDRGGETGRVTRSKKKSGNKQPEESQRSAKAADA